MVVIRLLKRCLSYEAIFNLGVKPVPHAHSSTTDPEFGTICVRPGEPLKSILHELAHIQAPDDNHGAKWRKRMRALKLDPDEWYWSESGVGLGGTK